jgi:hypothetical protein
MAQTKTDPIGALAYLDSAKTDTETPSALPTSDAILANMQKRMDELTGPRNQLENALQKAHAWTLYNKSPAFKNIAEQENQQTDQLQSIGSTMAQIKMQRDQMAKANQLIASLGDTGGGIGGTGTGTGTGTGVGGTTASSGNLNPKIMAALTLNASNPAEVAKIFKEVGIEEIKGTPNERKIFEWIMSLPPKDREPLLRQHFSKNYEPTVGVSSTGEKYNIPSYTQTSEQPTTAPTAPQNVSLAPKDVAEKLKKDFGIDLGPNALERDRAGQSGLIERNKAGDKTVHMPAPLVDGKEVYHENAIDVPRNVPEKYMNDLGYYRPFPEKDPVHYVPIKPTTTIAKPVAPKTENQLAIEKEQQVSDIQSKGKGEAKEYELLGKAAAEEASQTMDNWHTAETTKTNAQETIKLADRNKATLGIFKKAGPGVALANTLNEGLKLGIAGEIKVPLEELAIRLVPGSSDQAIRDRERLTSLLGDQNFQFVRMNKNQGSWSDIERKAVSGIVGTVSNSAEFIKRRAELLELRGEFDQKLGDTWRAYKKANPDKALYSKFQDTDAYENVVKSYKTALRTNFHKEYLKGTDTVASVSERSKSLMDKYPTKP